MPRRVLLPLLLAAVLSACGGDDDAVPVVVSAPVSTEPWIARSITNGAKLAVDEINAAGGLTLARDERRPLKLVTLDNASSPATALANAREAVDRKAAILITDGTGARAIGDLTDRAHLPAFVVFEGGAGLIDPQRHPTVFRLAPADAIMTRRLADYIANQLPKVAMITDDSGYGTQGRAALRDAFTVDEVQVVSDQVIPRRAQDLAPQILQAKRSGADRLVVWASAADVAATLEAVAKAGWDVPVLSGQTGEDPLIRQRLVAHPEYLSRLRFVSSRITAEMGPKPFNQFRARYERAVGVDEVGVQQDGRDVIQPPDWPMYPYDAVKLAAEAAKDAGALGAPLVQALNDGTRITGANGDQRAYNRDYHEGVSPQDTYFARYEGFEFVPVVDDPLSGTLPKVNQLR
ncbi:ABC-type branched-subunit amino acid transport system substrate-binding protein [Solirubrobacter pauli]|uniref:ABC-type branched-subunit amino acid transport system substrate-binding protein n=1 Tax=Solirubrobacter pauli TaxID=166793 RepID=A0A660LKT2_9ACTN|nr:ABC-type branched-subunit amino acid transport system substrate-binding protein [Solirubrobacter pauli]